jgi:hypothetical protein
MDTSASLKRGREDSGSDEEKKKKKVRSEPEWVLFIALEEQSDLTSMIAFDRTSTPDANLILRVIRDTLLIDAGTADCEHSNELMFWVSDVKASICPASCAQLVNINKGVWKNVTDEELLNGFACVQVFSYQAWA